MLAHIHFEYFQPASPFSFELFDGCKEDGCLCRNGNTRTNVRHVGHIIRIDDIDAKVIVAGIVSCQKCDASGPVNVKIVDAQQLPGGMQALREKRK